jgi:DNA-binding LytR/AlgR family response regulator
MKVVIIEDEKIAVDNLSLMLKETGLHIEIIAALDSVKKSVEWLSHNKADLIFMDIQLADDLSFSIFEQVKVTTPVIFITAYDHYALQAFKVNSIDYLLKPIEKSSLLAALHKYDTLIAGPVKDLTAILQSIRQPAPTYQKRFMVSAGNKIRSVEAEQITCFFSEGRYVTIFLNDGTRYLTDFTLDKLETILDPNDFFRINRSMVIAYKSISQMHTYTKSRIKIELKPDPGTEVIVSIDRSGDFKKWLSR